MFSFQLEKVRSRKYKVHVRVRTQRRPHMGPSPHGAVSSWSERASNLSSSVPGGDDSPRAALLLK